MEHVRPYIICHLMASLNKRTVIVFIMVLAHIAFVRGQCDMLIDYSVKDIPATTHGTLTMLLPDGQNVMLLNDTIKETQKVYRMEQLGAYRLKASITSEVYGNDSLEKCFMLTGEEDKVETIVCLGREKKNPSDWNSRDAVNSCRFTITKYSQPSPSVKIKYLRNCTGENGEFPGPVFLIKNESRDTLYGEWLPGFFWGRLSVWKDGEYEGNRGGQICTTGNEEPPLYPGQVKEAWVGSFGLTRPLPVGKYRFNLFYSTERATKNAAPLVRETETMKWWSAVQNWHLLTCEFEVKYNKFK